MNLPWGAYRLVAPCLGVLAPHAHFFASPQERPLWSERMGNVVLARGCHAWLHAASLGEAGAIPALARELAALQPGARFHFTTTTRTGRTRLRLLELPASLAPVDTPQAVRSFFAGVRPGRLFVVETEIWPHWLIHARRERVPVAFVSARLSERSVGRYRGLGSGLRALIAGLDAVLCQTEADAGRWEALGARAARTAVTGNLKTDGLPHPAADRGEARVALGLERDRPLLVLGSVRPGEVQLLARAWNALPPQWRERWQVVAVPRHARVSADLRAEAQRAGQLVVLDGAPRSGAWRWDDRVGVLVPYYAAADVAFVGGTLAPYGGHNPLEPAACGAAVLVGAHHESQAEAVRTLAAAGAALVVRDEAELAAALRLLLGEPEERRRRGAASLAAVEAQRGVAARTVRQLAAWELWPAR